MSPDFIMQVLVAILGAGAIYGGIRADIKGIHERVASNEGAVRRAHERIDNLIAGRGVGNA